MSSKKNENQENELCHDKVPVSDLLDNYFNKLEKTFPEVKKSKVMVNNVKKSIECMMENLDTDNFKNAAAKDIMEVGARVSKGSEASKNAHGVLAPKSNMLVMLAKVGDDSKTFSAATFNALLEELDPIIRCHGQDTAKKVIEDTLMLLYTFFADKFSGILVPSLLDVIATTLFPDVKESKDVEKLTKYLIDSALAMVPKSIQGKDIKKESTKVAQKFCSKAATVLSKDSAPIDEKNVEKMFDIIIQLGYDMIFSVMMEEGEAKKLVVPLLKDVIKLVADCIPKDMLD